MHPGDGNPSQIGAGEICRSQPNSFEIYVTKLRLREIGVLNLGSGQVYSD